MNQRYKVSLFQFACIVLTMSHSKSKDNNLQSTWCPNVKCTNGVYCKPCNQRYLFLLAQSRSGSTTIKNMINKLPNIRIGGETGQLIHDMTTLFNHIANDKSFKAKDFNMAWGHYKYDGPHYLSCPVQAMLHTLNPPKDFHQDDLFNIIGLKEVKVNSAEKIEFLIKYFPCSRFIFNIRTEQNGEDSVKKNFKDDKWLELRKTFPKLFKKYHEKLGEKRSYFMDMNEWSKDVKMFNDLASWLGYKNCIYSKILHDHKGNYKLDTTKIHLGADCYHVSTTNYQKRFAINETKQLTNMVMIEGNVNETYVLSFAIFFTFVLLFKFINCRMAWNKYWNKKIETE